MVKIVNVADCLTLLSQHLKVEVAIEDLLDFFSQSEFADNYICQVGDFKTLKLDAQLDSGDIEFFKSIILGES